MGIFDYQRRGLTILGLGQEPQSEFLGSILPFYRFFLWIYLLYFLVMYVIFIIENYDDVMETVLVVSSLAVDIISVVKMFAFWHRLGRVYTLMDKIQENADALDSKYVAKANRDGRIFTKGFLYQLVTAITLYNIMPIVMNLYNYFMHGSEWTSDMPLKFKSYVDTSHSPAYEITYIAIVLDIKLISATNFVVDSIFLICCFNIGAYFEILRDQVHDVEQKEFIGRHRDALALAKELNDLFRPIIFGEFLVISFVLCGIGFTVVMVKSFVELLMLICYGNVMLCQLFIYCYSGQYLTDRAVSVCDELYKLDRDYKLIIMRTQRGVRIEAPFFRATLEQFASVLNTTWALISVLKSSMR